MDSGCSGHFLRAADGVKFVCAHVSESKAGFPEGKILAEGVLRDLCGFVLANNRA